MMNDHPIPAKIISPTFHVTIGFAISIFVSIVVIASVFKVEVVARGQGKIVPIDRVQIVQPEYNGKIIAINIRNGSVVSKGDVLIELDATAADAEINTITSELVRLRIERARLEDFLRVGIENEDNSPGGFSALTLAVFDAGLDTKHNFYQEQQLLFAAETDDMLAALDRNAAQIEANENSIKVTKASIERVNVSIDIQKERLAAAKELLDSGASSRFAFLDVQEGFMSLEKEREIYLRQLEEKLSQGTALQAERRSIITMQQNQTLKRKSEIEARMATLDEHLRVAMQRKVASRLLAPKGGVVEQLKTFTIGGIARAGEELLNIVPDGQGIMIEGLFTNADIGFIKIGQQVNINLHAYPSSRYGYAKGIVTEVATDSTELAGGVWVYEIRIMLEKLFLQKGDQILPLRTGMTATLDITTSKRRIITYFFAPIIETIGAALGER